MDRLLQLAGQRQAAVAQMMALISLQGEDGEPRDMTDDEQTEFDALEASIGKLDTQIERAQRVSNLARANASVIVDPNAHAAGGERQFRDNAVITGGQPLSLNDPKGGFVNFGEFCGAVRFASMPGGQAIVDPRLMRPDRPDLQAAATTYSSEGVGADGGFLVPEEFSNRLRQVETMEPDFEPLCDTGDTSTNAMTFPADETVPWGTSGIQAYWEGEGDTAAQSKLATEPRTLRLRKLMCLVPVTDELLADAVALSGYIESRCARQINWKKNDALINGDGVGKPLGVTKSGAQVAVAKETSQTADTVNAQNVAKMYARNWAPARAVWVCNHDVLPQLVTMTLGNNVIWMPPSGNFVNAPGGVLLGRPVLISQTCATVGDLNDIQFIDFKGMQVLRKRGAGIETATSIHLWFDTGHTAFRATFRIDGQPWVRQAVTPANGSNSLSPFVALAARA